MITALGQDEIQATIDAGILPALLHFASQIEREETKNAVIEALCQVVLCGSASQLEHVMASSADDWFRCVTGFFVHNAHNYTPTVCLALDALKRVLDVGEEKRKATLSENGGIEGINKYAVMLEECGGLDNLLSLEGSTNTDISEKVQKVLELFQSHDCGEGGTE